VLVLHDTTELSFKREKPELIGSTCIVNGKDKKGRITFLRDSAAFKSGRDNGRASSRLGGH
jgi:hypothetical protein